MVQRFWWLSDHFGGKMNTVCKLMLFEKVMELTVIIYIILVKVKNSNCKVNKGDMIKGGRQLLFYMSS